MLIDDTEECSRAVAFAAYRIRRTGGSIVFLSVIDSADFQQFLGVEEVMRAEAEEEARRLIDTHQARVKKIADIPVEAVIREGRGPEPVEALIAEDREIAILVLAASAHGDGPGPMVTAFATRGANGLHIPVTIVPGSMSDAEIEAAC